MLYMCDAATCVLPSTLGNCSGTSHVDEICPWRFNAELTPSASGAAYRMQVLGTIWKCMGSVIWQLVGLDSCSAVG